jgi:hypothetical protein
MIIYGYNLQGLASHMANVPSTHFLFSPNVTYHVEFRGEAVQFYRNHSLKWRPHFREVGNGQIRFFGRTDIDTEPALVMSSTLAWPPASGPHPGTDNIFVKAPATFFTHVCITSCDSEDLWTSGTAKKTIGMLATNVVRDSMSFDTEYQEVIKLLDIDCSELHGETTINGEVETNPVGKFFWTPLPQRVGEHVLPLSMDMDDTRGRMAISMSDGSLAFIEFV